MDIPKISYNINGMEHSSVHAARLDKLGHVLTKPASWWLTGVSRVFLLDVKAGWWGQKSSKFKEGLFRVCLAILGLVTLPFVLIGLVFGAPFRAFASLSKKDFILHKSSTCHAPSSTLKILSFNTLLMPEFITRRNLQRPTMERVHEIAYALIEKAPNIICLQEAFHTEALEILDKELHRKGYSVVSNVGHQVLKLNSGLFLASKYDLSNVQFFQHPLKAGDDAFANKGLLLATAQIGNKTVVIANTHLNGGGNDAFPGYVCRTAQLITLTERVDKYVLDTIAAGKNVDGVILCGDTNISPAYYDGRDGKGDLIPTIEPEWLLSNRILPLKNALDMDKGWNAFSAKVKALFNELKQLSQTMDKNAFVAAGGAFPSQLYPHHVKSHAQALLGSTIDLGSSPQVGWGTAVKAQPELVDFITARKPIFVNGKSYASATVSDVEIVPMLSCEGRICSDHHAVSATLSF